MGVDRQLLTLTSAKLEFQYQADMEQDIPMISPHRLFVRLIEKPSFQVLKLTLVSEPFAA